MERNTNTTLHQATQARGTRYGLAFAALLGLSACGGGSGSGGSGDMDGTGGTQESKGTGGMGEGGGMEDLGPDGCPSLESVRDATYAVVAEYSVGSGSDKQKRYQAIGTAWAVRDYLLVTNAHVTEAFADYAKQGVQFDRVLGVQHGSGDVVELETAMTHNKYSGKPLESPDVGLFTTGDAVDSTLMLADVDTTFEIGDELQITGFPGDVNDSIAIVPGTTKPQATSLKGTVSSLRTYDSSQQVTAENLDIIQHQTQTTPGTSGSSVTVCGEVVGIHNAGTQGWVVVPSPSGDGSFELQQQVKAANAFAVHVKYVHDMLRLWDNKVLTSVDLPVKVGGDMGTGGNMGTGGDMGTGGNMGTGGDMGTGGNMGTGGDEGTVDVLVGQVGNPAPHTIRITIDQNGNVRGSADWNGSTYTLTGAFYTDGSIYFEDNGPASGEAQGSYSGQLVSNSQIEGIYYENGDTSQTAPFTLTLQ